MCFNIKVSRIKPHHVFEASRRLRVGAGPAAGDGTEQQQPHGRLQAKGLGSQANPNGRSVPSRLNRLSSVMTAPDWPGMAEYSRPFRMAYQPELKNPSGPAK